MIDTRDNWKYRYQPNDNPKCIGIVNDIVSQIKAELLPLLPLIPDFEIQFIKGLRRDLGKLWRGTSKKPLILLCMNAIVKVSEEIGAPVALAIETTIVHELAHAIQEQKGLPLSESQAEDLASHWFDWREVREWAI